MGRLMLCRDQPYTPAVQHHGFLWKNDIGVLYAPREAFNTVTPLLIRYDRLRLPGHHDLTDLFAHMSLTEPSSPASVTPASSQAAAIWRPVSFEFIDCRIVISDSGHTNPEPRLDFGASCHQGQSQDTDSLEDRHTPRALAVRCQPTPG